MVAHKPFTKRPCPSCGRVIAEVSAGSLRPHKASGTPCPGDGGICATCGRAVPLDDAGLVSEHKQLLVRRAFKPARDGWVDEVVEGETYSSKEDCPGAGELPEAMS